MSMHIPPCFCVTIHSEQQIYRWNGSFRRIFIWDMASRYRQTLSLLEKISNYPYYFWNFLTDPAGFNICCILYQIRVIFILYFHIFKIFHWYKDLLIDEPPANILRAWQREKIYQNIKERIQATKVLVQDLWVRFYCSWDTVPKDN